MKNDKKIFIMIETVLAIMVLIAATCMIQEGADVESPKVSVIVQDSDNSRWGAFKYGLEMAAADYNVEIYVVTTGKTMTAEEEMAMMESEVENGAEAVIVQPVSSIGGNGMENFLEKINRKVPVIQVESSAETENGRLDVPVMKPEHYKMGAALAEEVRKDCGDNLEGKTIGIVSEEKDTKAIQEKENGVTEGILSAGGTILWSVKGYSESKGNLSLPAFPKVDVLIALDDGCVLKAGEAAADEKLHDAAIYGIGNSMEAFYYLDTGNVDCLIVPDEFYLGYQSVVNVAERMERLSGDPKDLSMSYSVIRRDNLFSEDNQSYLFSLTQ